MFLDHRARRSGRPLQRSTYIAQMVFEIVMVAIHIAGIALLDVSLDYLSGKTDTELDYYKGKGLNLFRLPFLWERVQPSLYGGLNQTELSRLDNVVAAARNRGMKVILDPHNYARYRLNGTEYLIGSSQVPTSP